MKGSKALSMFFWTVMAVFIMAAAFVPYTESAPDSPAITGGKVNGEFEVSVFKDGKWQKAGSLAFDQFFGQKTINISSAATEGKVRVKISQKSGEASHIDSVFLGNIPPIEVKGTDEPLIMKKISRKDFDVIDASGKGLELVFNA